MRIHFIAIGGSAMHNLAIAMCRMGHQVSGSDDQIFEPSRSRLDKEGILPEEDGWSPELISEELDAVILGMHAHKDNPELEKAKELGLQIFSYPEFLYAQCVNKMRVVIGGSHGKTSITAMILHVLKSAGIRHDYMVGAQLEGFDCMVSITDAPIAVFEGDEYLSSALDMNPKFLHYRPQIAVISGIAWDHVNVFPSFSEYTKQFERFTDSILPGGTLFTFEKDPQLIALRGKLREDIQSSSYNSIPHRIEAGGTILEYEGVDYPTKIFGEHNMQNLSAAFNVCSSLGVDAEVFYKSIQSFGGASNRLELIIETPTSVAYRDFAHSPSKLKATVNALKRQYPDRKLVACMELHTYSSLNATFITSYRGTLNPADEALVFYSPKALAMKRLPPLAPSDIAAAFAKQNLVVTTDAAQVLEFLDKQEIENTNFLFMSSGNYGGADLQEWATAALAN
jgi:UDP-N-acetylmuramate: L-alanyl-gamma-D-glutamyl-meso-diaminopimelate ligase